MATQRITNRQVVVMAEERLKGRAVGAGTGDQADLTPDQAQAILDNATDPYLKASTLPDQGFTNNFLLMGA